MTKTEAIEKIFTEIESLISALLQEATDHTNDWKNNPEHSIKKAVERRLDDLFGNDEKRLPYSLYELKEMLAGVIDGLPGLVDREGKMNQDLVPLLTNVLAASEKIKGEAAEKKELIIPTPEDFYELLKKKANPVEEDEIKKLLREILEKLTKESAQQQQLIIDLPKELERILISKKPEPISSGAGSESKAKKEIQTELDNFKKFKIEEATDEECFDWLNKFKKIRNWIITGNEEEIEAAMGKQSELKEITSKLGLETHRRRAKQKIIYALKDEYEYEEEGEESIERIVLENVNLTRIEYIDFETTLKKKTSKKEMDDFSNEVIKDIYGQRQKHENIINVLKEGKEALEHQDVENAKEILLYLQLLERLPGQKQVFRSNKIIEINRLKKNIDSLISQQAQIAQDPK